MLFFSLRSEASFLPLTCLQGDCDAACFRCCLLCFCRRGDGEEAFLFFFVFLFFFFFSCEPSGAEGDREGLLFRTVCFLEADLEAVREDFLVCFFREDFLLEGDFDKAFLRDLAALEESDLALFDALSLLFAT